MENDDALFVPLEEDSFPNQTQRYPGLGRFYDFYFDIHGYLAMTVCLWGICANMANIVVLTRKNMASPTNTILTWLAVADLMTMLSCLPISIHFYILHDPALPFPSTRHYGWIGFMLFYISFSVLCHTIAIWLAITLAIFRYLFICHPTHGRDLCTQKRAKIAVFCVYFFTTILCIPHYMSTEIAKRPIGHSAIETIDKSSLSYSNQSIFNEEEASFYVITEVENDALLNFNYWVQSILVKIIPCILLTKLTIMLIIAMHKANRRRKQLISQGRQGESEREHETNRTTGMLLAIVTLFLVTELPNGILTLCSVFIPWFFSEVYLFLGDLLDIAALINNSINFVLYCTMSRQFRNTFVKVFCKCFTDFADTERTETIQMRTMTSRPLISEKPVNNGHTVQNEC